MSHQEVKSLIKQDPVCAIKGCIASMLLEGDGIFEAFDEVANESNIRPHDIEGIIGSAINDERISNLFATYADQQDMSSMDIATFVGHSRTILIFLCFFLRDLIEREEVHFRRDHSVVMPENNAYVANAITNYAQDESRKVKVGNPIEDSFVVTFGNTTFAISHNKENILANADKLFLKKDLFTKAITEDCKVHVIRIFDEGGKEVEGIENVFEPVKEPDTDIMVDMFGKEPYYEYVYVLNAEGTKAVEFVYQDTNLERAGYLAAKATVMHSAMIVDTLVNVLLYRGDNLLTMWSESAKSFLGIIEALNEAMSETEEETTNKRILH